MNFKNIGLGLAATAAMTAGMALAATPVQALNLVSNGSFELGTNPGTFSTEGVGSTSITGWEIVGGSVDYIGSYWQASEGSRSLDMNGNGQGRIQQVLTTVIGQTYQVSFDIAGNPDSGPVQKVLSAIMGTNSQQFTFDTTGNSRSAMGWITQSFLFTADSTSTTLAFLGDATATAFGPALDNISVTEVPTPALLPGLVGLGMAALRKRKGEAEQPEAVKA